MPNAPAIIEPRITPKIGIITNMLKINWTTTMITNAIIKNAIILAMPILFMSSNTSPKFIASPNSLVWANLAIAITSKIANNMNITTATIDAIPNPANRLLNPAPIAPVTIAKANVMTKGTIK